MNDKIELLAAWLAELERRLIALEAKMSFGANFRHHGRGGLDKTLALWTSRQEPSVPD